MNDRIGRTIGGCRVDRRIGAGGMGVVFEAHHLALDKRVALKLLMPHLAADQGFVKRFVTEARLAAQVEHPNIVHVLNVGQDGDVYFIVMQFIEGQSLAELICRGRLAPRDAAKVALQAARGLAAAHKRGIIHRDIKPENILIDAGGVARVVDMGLSKDLSSPGGGSNTEALTAPGVAMGTPNYISPEQATEARRADVRSDVYSLGATLYHALTGAPPFSGPSAIAIINHHINSPLQPPSARCPDVPPELDRLVAAMMAKRPEKRIQTMDEVVAELRRFLAGAGESIGPASAVALKPDVAVAVDATTVGVTGAVAPEGTTCDVPGGGAAKRAAGHGVWKYALLGAVGMLVALVLLGMLGRMVDPARAAFRVAEQHERDEPWDFEGALALYRDIADRHPGSAWGARARAAMDAVSERREAEGREQFQKIAKEAEICGRFGNWVGAEVLWNNMPVQFAPTQSGEAAREMAVKAHISARAAGLFAAIAEGKPESIDRATTYSDPRLDEKGRRFFVGLVVGLVKLSRGTPQGFEVDSVELSSPEQAVLLGHFTMNFGALKPPERHPLETHWQLINGEWYTVEKPRPADERGGSGIKPGKPSRVPDRPERRGRAGADEIF